MAKFKIYSPAGTEIYEGAPSFTGQYMAPGLLEFREIASPVPLDLVAGCYVDYTRTGFRYRIYGVPQVKKQARQRSYGGAFIYQNVQLYDASKMLEFCPFRDLVKGDNRIHFSTQPSISTFEGVDGLARRFEACLQDQYGANSWRVRIATTTDGISQDLADLMADAREFTVSGVNILECLNKVYEIWPEVGWVYTVEEGIDTIIIGGAGLNANQGTYAYGKGNGLTSLTRTVANADEMANRIYAYGSSRNMLPRWYNNQTIKDAESVDIQNLMIPASSWGVTDGLPDAAKAYVEDDASITKMGLRPATVYFDGSGEYPEIYPTIREATIGEVRTWIQQHSSSPRWSPSTTVYTSTNERVDVLKSAQATFDSGKAGDDGKNTIFTEYQTVTASGSETIEAGTKRYTQTIITQSVDFSASEAGTRNVSIMLSMPGSLSLTGATSAAVRASLHKDHPANASTVMSQVELTPGATAGTFNFSTIVLSGMKKEIAAGTYYLVVDLDVALEESETDLTLTYDASGDLSVSLSQYRSKTFTVTLKQIGFDISEQAALGDGKTISMRSGSCVGRSFTINTVQYDSAGDAWALECFRSEDESLSQWFPNTDYPVRAGDEFVLLDIAMPEIYIGIAEGRLLHAAQDLLSDTATERWQYVPEIDAKYMVENNRVIRAGEYMTFLDPEIIEEGTDGYVYFKTSNDEYLLTSNGEKIIVGGGMVTSILVDTIVINEGDAAIPTYKVTLRDRKRKTWTESESAPTSTSKSVGTVNEVAETSSSGSGDSFWTLDDNGNVTLKSQYENAWVPGWIAAGGVGSGSGGSGGASAFYDLVDVSVDGRKQGDLLTYNGSHWVNMERSSLLSDYYTKSQVDTLLSNIDLDGLLTSITTQEDGTLDFTWNNGDVTKVDLTHRHLDLESAIASLRIWIDDGQGNLTLDTTKYSNLWIPGWIAAGGVGSGSGGSGGASAFYDLVDVSVDGRKQGDLLVYDGTHWINIPQSSIVPSVSISFDDLTDHPTTLGGYGITDAALASDLTKLATRVNSIEDWFEVVMVDGTPTLYAKSGRAIYSDSWIASGGVGSSSSGGSSVSWGTVSGNTVELSVEGDEKTLLLSGALSDYAKTSWLEENYLALTGGTLTGDLRLKPSSKNFGSTLRFGDGDYAYIKEDTDDHLYFYASKGIKLETGNDYDISLNGVNVSDIVTLSGEQTITGAKTFSEFIDIGNARLMYDSVANALHVTKRTGGTVTPVGLYADGFVAAGGVGSGSSGLDDTVTQNSSYPVKSSGIYSFVTARRWVGTQAQYDALGTYDSNVEYLITES